MPLENIRPLDNIGLVALYDVWQQAFADYERSWSYEEFEAMLHRRGFEAGLSFGAFIDENLVSFTLNGIGNFEGRRTAYDTGTGTIRAYRGRGLAGRVFQESLPHLLRAGIRQYLLEVLQHNTSAIRVYEQQGFLVRRSLGYFTQEMAALPATMRTLPAPYRIALMGHQDRGAMSRMWAFTPSWQNSFEAIDRKPSDFVVLGAYHHALLVGYGIIAPSSGDITQLAVAEAYRRQGIGSGLLAELLRYNRHHSVKAINIETACGPCTAFFERAAIPQRGTQSEMIRPIP